MEGQMQATKEGNDSGGFKQFGKCKQFWYNLHHNWKD
jgi:hypothetical protein